MGIERSNTIGTPGRYADGFMEKSQVMGIESSKETGYYPTNRMIHGEIPSNGNWKKAEPYWRSILVGRFMEKSQVMGIESTWSHWNPLWWRCRFMEKSQVMGIESQLFTAGKFANGMRFMEKSQVMGIERWRACPCTRRSNSWFMEKSQVMGIESLMLGLRLSTPLLDSWRNPK